MCREEGKSLTELAAGTKDSKPLDGFGIFGIVKETGVDDEGLFAFQKQYFNYPLYRNEDLDFYQLVGKRSMGVKSLLGLFLWNGRSITNRMKKKNIEGNMVGEGLKQGGVVVFDKNGKQRYIYQEITGNDLPVDDIAAAVKAVREE